MNYVELEIEEVKQILTNSRKLLFKIKQLVKIIDEAEKSLNLIENVNKIYGSKLDSEIDSFLEGQPSIIEKELNSVLVFWFSNLKEKPYLPKEVIN